MRRAGGGSIINTSSIWGKVGATGVAAYTASKAAVSDMSKNYMTGVEPVMDGGYTFRSQLG
jgi:NAD(P)-dependent dehydrogenase (short-subunit alcohol dehydrogenase family)